eukprot:TRINITY_DN3383_c0_g1_i7.p1 TRINITY_DN3383_c0_g1~~TRINITY_DN3383_c0_g1_i7.p1  ORF type:complete len:485 (+),score=184.56 TRINITY_DN3383_c0_g1_i7:65-1456(+)
MSICIFVRHQSGKTFSVTLNGGETVADLKRLLQTQASVHPSEQKLLYQGKELRDDQRLKEDCGVEKEAIIKLQVNAAPKMDSKPKSKCVSDDDDAFIGESFRSKSKSSKCSMEYTEYTKPSSHCPTSSTCTTTTTTPTPTEPLPPPPNAEETKKGLIDSFRSGSSSKDVEVVFSFDTTGSMYSYLTQVRNELANMIARLLKDLPSIRIGVIAHGDYCDSTTYIVRSIDLTTDKDKLLDFVRNCPPTGGGDAPECYEAALREARFMSWSPGASKALVMIGDDLPHPPNFTTAKIHFLEEVEALRRGDFLGAKGKKEQKKKKQVKKVESAEEKKTVTPSPSGSSSSSASGEEGVEGKEKQKEKETNTEDKQREEDESTVGVKIYGVQANSQLHARKFFQEMAKRTAGFYVELNSLNLITEMFLAGESPFPLLSLPPLSLSLHLCSELNVCCSLLQRMWSGKIERI